MDILDAAYPPALAQDWDSVGLVAGDPAEPVDLGDGGGGRHRGRGRRDARGRAAAGAPSTAVARCGHGGRLHRQGCTDPPDDPVRAGAVHRAHQRRLGVPGRLRCAGRDAGTAWSRMCCPAGRPGPTWTSGWCSYRSNMPRRCGIRCSPRAPVRSVTTPVAAGALPAPVSSCHTRVRRPAIGEVGTVEQVTEDRVEVIAPARLRGRVLAALRAAHPYEEPAFDVFALAPLPADVGIGRICTLPEPEPLSAFVSRVRGALPVTTWGVRAAGVADAVVSRVARLRRRGRFAAGRGPRRRSTGLCDRRSAAPPGRRARPGL